MKKTLLLSLLLTASASAAHLQAPPRRTLTPVSSSRKAEVLREARATFTLPDGSLWVTHPVPAESEPGAVGVTRFSADGSAHVFLVSDWLPKGSIPHGWAGQVHAVTMLADGRIAASAGWTDGRASHNAIFILRKRTDGWYSTDKTFEWPGIGHIIAGPQNTILAITNDPARPNGGPLVTLFDTNGEALGAHLATNARQTVLEAAQNAWKARLRRMSETRYAIYDAKANSVWILNVEATPKGSVWSTHTSVFIGDDPHTAHLPLVGFEVSPDGRSVLVARTGVIDGRPATKLTLYDKNSAEVQETTVTDAPWNLMIRENDQVHGLVRHREVLLDTVRFVAD
jgi:hypothetical protein